MKKILIAVILTASVALNVVQYSVVSKTSAPNSGGAEATTTIEMDQIILKQTDDMRPPIRGEYWITSDFGLRKSPFTGQTVIHYGTDYGANKNAVIQAVKDGVVVTHWPPPDGYYSGHDIYGGYIEILHDDGISRYAHMSRTFVHEGQQIKAGDKIGIIGNTGKTAGKNGIHLHFSFIRK